MKRKRAAPSRAATTKPAPARRRTQRPRPVPRWLTGSRELDEVARRRLLMLLSVLSGEKPVTAIIGELGISRGTYYQLETKALIAMLQALAPGVEAAASPEAASPAQRVASLEQKVTRLEQDKRRLERLLYLTRKVVPAGPVALPGRGRPRRPRNSAGAGRGPSRSSMRSTAPTRSMPSPSTPTTDGATTP